MRLKDRFKNKEITFAEFEKLFYKRLMLILKSPLVSLIKVEFLSSEEILKRTNGGSNIAFTDGHKIYIIKLKHSKATSSVLLTIYLHEIFHIILKHLDRAASLSTRINNFDMNIFNIAADHVVNTMIIKLAESSLFIDSQICKKMLNFAVYENMPAGPTELVYRLMSHQNYTDPEPSYARPLKMDDSTDIVKEITSNGKFNHINVSDAQKISKTVKESLISKIIDSGAPLKEVIRSIGDDHMQSQFEKELFAVTVDKETLNKVFFNSFENRIKGDDDLTYCPYNLTKTYIFGKKFSVPILYPGNIINKPEMVGILIDNSLSVNVNELETAFSSLSYLINKYHLDVRLLIFDTKIHYDVVIENEIHKVLTPENLSQYFVRGGGTDLRKGMEIFELDKRISTYVVFTDGGTSWPRCTRKKVYFLIYETEHFSDLPTFGKVLYI